MVNDRVNIAKRLRKTPEELAKENFYDDASYKIEPLLFEMVYEIVCGSDEGSYDDVFIKAADLIDPTCKPVITVESLTNRLQSIRLSALSVEQSLEIFRHANKQKRHTLHIALAAAHE